MSAEQFPIRKESGMNRPVQVQKARAAGDTEALRAMGRAGAAVTNEKRARTRIEDEMVDMKRAEEELERQHQTGEDIVPVQ
jgi:hypothetical protein